MTALDKAEATLIKLLLAEWKSTNSQSYWHQEAYLRRLIKAQTAKDPKNA